MIQVFDSLQSSDRPTSIALGCFDGLHLGHKEVIIKAKSEALGVLCPTVFTFNDIPNVKLNNNNLLSFEDKVDILETWGIEKLYAINFSSVMDLSPEDFVVKVLKDKLNAKKVFCGFNYKFGKGGSGDVDTLIKLCKETNIKPYVMEPVSVDDKIVSSTLIRQYIKNGNLESAEAMLGRRFSYNLKVVEGKKLGRVMGTPTLNQIFPENFIVPRFGVYASVSYVGDEKYWSVTNIGVNPTTGDGFPKSETWMPEYKAESLYGKYVRVELIKYIREEKKFESLEELKDAILNDARLSKNIILRKNNTLR